jgi:hypothetical protein
LCRTLYLADKVNAQGDVDSRDLARRLAHVRWVGGGTGTGKSTIVRVLADRHQAMVYDGDAAERGYIGRCTPASQPYLSALVAMSAEQRIGRSVEEIFATMPSRHGETFPFVLGDLLTLPNDAVVLVDDFRPRPSEVAPLLTWPDQAVFMLPTAEFRHRALTDRFADAARARANWGDGDHARALANRLGRDALWDEEILAEATDLGLSVIVVDGTRTVDELATELAERFRLSEPTHRQ